MKLSLTINSKSIVAVSCNDEPSHDFKLKDLHLGEWDDEHQAFIISDPKLLGESLYQALFPEKTLASQVLDTKPSRILIVTEENSLDVIPWEFLHGPDGYLGLDYPILRGLNDAKSVSIQTP